MLRLGVERMAHLEHGRSIFEGRPGTTRGRIDQTHCGAGAALENDQHTPFWAVSLRYAISGGGGCHAESLAPTRLCEHVPVPQQRHLRASPPDPRTGTWVLDLDGVVWLTGHPIEGSVEAIENLSKAGIRVLFVTNNAALTPSGLVERLAEAGIPAQTSDVVSSAQAAASLVKPGSRAFVCGDEGVSDALAERGVDLVTGPPADAVVVGWTRKFDYDLLEQSMRLVRSGARLIGTNADPTHPVPDGLSPGAGSILAAVATASQVTPEVAGKPEVPMAELVLKLAQDVSMVVGDRPATDGLFAKRLGVSYGLVYSGVTPETHGTLEHDPDVDGKNLAGIVRRVLGVP
jgi:glycerol-1-phosphatase